jgi:Tol biopolymer transport system component
VLPENTVLNSLAISPDGKRLAYVVNGPIGFSTLWLRSMDSTQAQEIPGSEDGTLPFWSPDSRSIGFFTETQLKKWTIDGGVPETLCAVENPKGGTWNQFGDILFSRKVGAGLYRISERGGEETPATTLNQSLKEVRHMFPHFLPDGRHFFYTSNAVRREHMAVYLGSLDSKDRKLILPELASVSFIDPGYLFFPRNDKLMVQHFDKERLELSGDAIPIADNLSGRSFSVSQSNILVNVNFDGWDTQPIWFDRSGKQSSPAPGYPSAVGEPGGYDFCDLSRDDKRLLIVRNGVMWMVDLLKGSFDRYAMTNEAEAIFSPDGTQVAYVVRQQDLDMYTRPSNGLGKEELLYRTESNIVDLDWSADGKYITFTGVVKSGTNFDLFALPLDGKRKPFPFLETETREESAVLSPDGKWFAYQSYHSGRSEIYVRSFPVQAGGMWAISTDGGEQPSWRSDGKELFYLTLDKGMMAVEVETGEIFKPGASRFLFQTRAFPRLYIGMFGSGKQYFVSSDGKHFLVNSVIDKTAQTEINVLLNWKSLLKK